MAHKHDQYIQEEMENLLNEKQKNDRDTEKVSLKILREQESRIMLDKQLI